MDSAWDDEVKQAFFDRFGTWPEVCADAGGRVNLIGEHTDYHDGFVLPAAISLRTLAIGARRDDGILRILGVNVDSEITVSVDELEPFEPVDWRSYVLGPFWVLREEGLPVVGADIMVGGDVPFGGGLSSSAAIEVALVGLGAKLAGIELEPMEVAQLAQHCENHFCGVPCGIMDQVASACGEDGCALLLDCRSLEYVPVPVPQAWKIVVADSGVRHSLAGGEYARRQQECEDGMGVIRSAYPEVEEARDVSMQMLDTHRAQMSAVSYRRLSHVVTENERTIAAKDALSAGSAEAIGRLMAGSHESLAKNYEVSCPELDILVEEAGKIPGCIGSRLTGAGFGGNTVNLVTADHVDAFVERLKAAYLSRTGRKTTVLVVEPSSGLVVQTC